MHRFYPLNCMLLVHSRTKLANHYYFDHNFKKPTLRIRERSHSNLMHASCVLAPLTESCDDRIHGAESRNDPLWSGKNKGLKKSTLNPHGVAGSGRFHACRAR